MVRETALHEAPHLHALYHRPSFQNFVRSALTDSWVDVSDSTCFSPTTREKMARTIRSALELTGAAGAERQHALLNEVCKALAGARMVRARARQRQAESGS